MKILNLHEHQKYRKLVKWKSFVYVAAFESEALTREI